MKGKVYCLSVELCNKRQRGGVKRFKGAFCIVKQRVAVDILLIFVGLSFFYLLHLT